MTESFKPDWDAMAVMVEEQQRMAKRIEELEQALAQPVQPAQKPVALECTYGYNQCQALALAQQKQRPWVGLKDDEIKAIIGSWGDTPIKGYTRKLFDKIEAKLKEKNHD